MTVAAACMLVLAGGADAVAAKQTPRPVVSRIDATPDSIPPAGGAVLVRAYVQGAARCAFSGQHGASARVVHIRTVSCKGGHATVRATVAPNRTHHLMVVRFRVTAASAHLRRATAKVEVVQEPSEATTPVVPTPTAPSAGPVAIDTVAVPPASLGVAYSTTLVATGGTEPYAWSVTAGSLAPGLTVTPAGAITGTPSSAGVWSFTAQVSDGRGQTDAVQYVLTVAAAVPAATGPTFTSTNWSGYFVEGGPFTGVTGTFNVPALDTGTVDASAAEWVGIDGTSSSNPTIIQTGVAEDYSAAASGFVVTPWIELYPAPAYRLPLDVSAGDRITVTIALLDPGTWSVVVADDTNGETFSSSEPYAGPASSAEWIVEAPYSTFTNSIVPLASFSPVTFGRLGLNPGPGSFGRVVMVQNGVPVSTPSDLTPNGFTVAYGSVTPAAP